MEVLIPFSNSEQDLVKCEKESSYVGRLNSEVLNLIGKHKKVRNKSSKPGNGDDDFDDNASVCSSLSSASEHSIKVSKKVKKVKRPPCELHPKSGDSKTTSSLPDDKSKDDKNKEENDKVPSSESTGTGICTCRKTKSEGKSREKSRVKRPEPEGGLVTNPFKGQILDEFERVIYSDERMFSDLEEDPVIDEQIRAESERFHKRIGTADGDNIFSAIQMLNTNTMIKFAILQTELKNIKDVSLKRNEVDLNSLLSRLENMNEHFKSSYHDFKSIGELLTQVAKDWRASNSSNNTHFKSTNDNKAPIAKSDSSLPAEYPFYHFMLSPCSIDLELAERKLESAELKVVNLEEDLKHLSSRCKSENDEMRRLKSSLLQAQSSLIEAEKTVQHMKSDLGHKIR